MCIGFPMKVLWAGDFMAVCAGDGAPEEIDIRLVGPVSAGDWLLVFLGSARRLLEAQEAMSIAEALRGLMAAGAGNDFAGMFPDLEGREPVLPPHLELARKAGATSA